MFRLNFSTSYPLTPPKVPEVPVDLKEGILIKALTCQYLAPMINRSLEMRFLSILIRPRKAPDDHEGGQAGDA